jgi:hypothetical protein
MEVGGAKWWRLRSVFKPDITHPHRERVNGQFILEGAVMTTKSLRLGVFLSVLVCMASPAWALLTGFNADIHMDIDRTSQTKANDFHVEGIIKSGPVGGAWSKLPVLVMHVDDRFPNFAYNITPDHADPDQNTFFFKADWSGAEYRYCEVLHLGLLFDVECHNMVIELVGWWTFNGAPLPGQNAGRVLIPGFDVRDDNTPRRLQIRNDSGGGGGAAAGINGYLRQLEVITMTREEILPWGSPEGLFAELRLGGEQEQLPWTPVITEGGRLLEGPFLVDSFFDVFLDLEIPDPSAPHPASPMVIQPGGFLIGREVVEFPNNSGEPDVRWTWHFHQAHEEAMDFGDAPDDGSVFRYPTLAVRNGARHKIDPAVFLGNRIDVEYDGQPSAGADGDDTDTSGDDEDGVTFVTWPLRPGMPAAIEVTASVDGFLSAWIDFAADGDWTEPADQVFLGLPISAGVNTLTFGAPITAKPNAQTYGRFRFATAPVPSYEGAVADGEVEDCLIKVRGNPGIKWIQRPDVTPLGIDIRVDGSDGVPRVLADDFECTDFGRITDVHLWGSWKDDVKGEITSIHLSIHSDDPVGAGGTEPANNYSKPDKLLWERDLGPELFVEKPYATMEEGEWWWDPYSGVVIMPGDHRIWQVDIRVPKDGAFLQEGSPDKPVVYWLDVAVKTEGGQFGWKTRRWPAHFNDDAVMGVPGQPGAPMVWRELRYPDGHPLHPESLDMAFVITGDDTCTGCADLNCDGVINLGDLAVLAEQYLTVWPFN